MAIGNKYGNDPYGRLASCKIESIYRIIVYYVYIHNMVFFLGYGGGGGDLGDVWVKFDLGLLWNLFPNCCSNFQITVLK